MTAGVCRGIFLSYQKRGNEERTLDIKVLRTIRGGTTTENYVITRAGFAVAHARANATHLPLRGLDGRDP